VDDGDRAVVAADDAACGLDLGLLGVHAPPSWQTPGRMAR
jgi:hypothetical protein